VALGGLNEASAAPSITTPPLVVVPERAAQDRELSPHRIATDRPPRRRPPTSYCRQPHRTSGAGEKDPTECPGPRLASRFSSASPTKHPHAQQQRQLRNRIYREVTKELWIAPSSPVRAGLPLPSKHRQLHKDPKGSATRQFSIYDEI